jgi:hypothetical protein
MSPSTSVPLETGPIAACGFAILRAIALRLRNRKRQRQLLMPRSLVSGHLYWSTAAAVNQREVRKFDFRTGTGSERLRHGCENDGMVACSAEKSNFRGSAIAIEEFESSMAMAIRRERCITLPRIRNGAGRRRRFVPVHFINSVPAGCRPFRAVDSSSVRRAGDLGRIDSRFSLASFAAVGGSRASRKA